MPFALVLTGLLALLAIFQLTLVLGAPFGRFAWGGQQRVLPARLRIGSAVTILVYALIVAIAWDRIGALDLLTQTLSIVAMWIVFGFFVLGIAMNAVSRSKPERNTMVPTSILLAALSLLIAMGYGEMAMAI
ncbi:hypothetical protein [Microbacterium candidum]|uniref:Multidrug DMT transporter permease n=1 Tax=Microbacterium candidum TaxID=3041922 RepID=A0ABT7MUZ2_9MICO|nr:hypothetical protein [Microbacterium sp. ASV49]MDL9978238.1 hypothetical protein [Microbacterium sp. ASV49]